MSPGRPASRFLAQKRARACNAAVLSTMENALAGEVLARPLNRPHCRLENTGATLLERKPLDTEQSKFHGQKV